MSDSRQPERLPLWQGLTIAFGLSILLWAIIGGSLWLAFAPAFPMPR
jgi:hypothetical protein